MLAIDDRQFTRVAAFVRETYGIDLSKKRALIQSRLALDIERRGYSSFEQFFDAALRDPAGAECQHMIDKLSTNHTFFFREPACFAHMLSVALPALVARGKKTLHIWCAAAATGQECYTVAMLLEDALARHVGLDYHILGSDINCEVLEIAREGAYPASELANIPDGFQSRFCRKQGERFSVAPALKERIVWKQQNLLPPLNGFGARAFDLIFCRNVMIYFAPAVKEALTSELYRIVDDGGFVYVGSTETLDMKRTRFLYRQPSVFEKRQPA